MRGARILDLSTSRAGAYCARLLATTGAEVFVAEPPGGHPLRDAPPFLPDGRSASWEYLQSYKQPLIVGAGAGAGAVEAGAGAGAAAGGAAKAVDPEEEATVEVAASFDVIVTSGDGDPTGARRRADRWRAAHPGLVVVVVSPFGLTGPYAAYRTEPLEDWAAGGHLALNGEPHREPIPGGGPWVSYLHGATAAVGAQVALHRSRRTGRGDVVDVGAMEALACAHQWSVVIFTHQGVVKRRWGNRHGEAHHPLSLHPCVDGWVCIASVTRHQWEGLCLAMDHPELLAHDDLYVPATRFDRADELDLLINGWTARHTMVEVVEQLQANQCPAGPVRSFTDILADPHIARRGYLVAAPHLGEGARMPGVPFTLNGTAPPFRPAPGPPGTAQPVGEGASGSPTLGAPPAAPARADPPLPLAGIRIVELSVAWAGPLAGRFLADLGADVVKVEHPTSRGLSVIGGGRGDWDPSTWEWGTIPPAEHRNGIFPDADPGERWWNRMAWFNKMNRGKRSLCIDVKGPGGREVFEALVARADVVLNNYSPRGVRSLGIDHETLRAVNPHVVTVDLSGFGAVGPAAEQVSWGPILDAASGLAAATGYADSGPYKQGLALADAVGGVHGAYAVLAALWERDVTGGPVHVDMSQLETMVGLAGELVLQTSMVGEPPERRGARSAHHAPQGVYPCAGDDEWLALTVPDEQTWRALVDTVGPALDVPAWRSVAGRRDGHDRIDAVIGTWLASRDKHAAMAGLQAAGVPAAAVMTNRDLVQDPHLIERGLMVTLEQVDCTPRTFPGFPLHFDEATVDLRPTPALGAHNREILRELGWSESRIGQLEADHTVCDRPPS